MGLPVITAWSGKGGAQRGGGRIGDWTTDLTTGRVRKQRSSPPCHRNPHRRGPHLDSMRRISARVRGRETARSERHTLWRSCPSCRRVEPVKRRGRKSILDCGAGTKRDHWVWAAWHYGRLTAHATPLLGALRGSSTRTSTSLASRAIEHIPVRSCGSSHRLDSTRPDSTRLVLFPHLPSPSRPFPGLAILLPRYPQHPPHPRYQKPTFAGFPLDCRPRTNLHTFSW